MEELKKLIAILELKGSAPSAALLNYSDSQALEIRLYNLIKENPDYDTNAVILELYGAGGNENAFKMLKSRVKKKLYNQLHYANLDNLKKFTAKTAADLKCNVLINQAIILEKNHNQDLSDKLITQAIKAAKEVDNTNNIIRALEVRRSNYNYHAPSIKRYSEVETELQQLYELRSYEEKAASYYQKCMLELRLGVETRYKSYENFKQRINELGELWHKTGSSTIYSNYHFMYSAYLELIGDHNELIRILKELIGLINSKRLNSNLFDISRTKFLLVYAYLNTKQFKEGFAEAEELKYTIEEGTNNWFAHMENYFLLAVHSQDYSKAQEILTEVLSNKYLKETTTFSQERWLLFYRSLNYISGFAAPGYKGLKLKHVPQDKKGFNVWNLILDFILVLEKKQQDLLESEISRLRKYMAKHLAANEDVRTKLFLKLLQTAGREFADAKACKRKGSYLFNKLRKTPVAGTAYAETEIIPYEHLWKLILQKMKHKE